MNKSRVSNYKQFVAKKLTLNCHYRVKLSNAKSHKRLEKWFAKAVVVFEKYLQTASNIYHPRSEQWEINIELCGKGKMTRINHLHRGKKKKTDVLSFPLEESLRKSANSKRPELDGPFLCLGDILICREQAEIQARDFGLTAEGEVLHLLVHGFLHLLGFDHELSDKEEEIMQKEESKLLKYLID